jgi:uncharacterized cupredoxin-like copper-binding protein
MTSSPLPTRLIIAVVLGVIALATGSTVAVAAGSGSLLSSRIAPDGRCIAPRLPGTVVDVRLTNMGGPMMNGWVGPTMGWVGGTMRVVASRRHVPAGTVSLRVANIGSLTHELVVLPLATRAEVSRRAVATNGKVSETGSVGQASHSCGEGSGDGLAPGAIGWTTLNLAPGAYELVCNLPGHYAAGMYTALQAT